MPHSAGMDTTPVSFSSAYLGSHQPTPSAKLKIRDGAYIEPLDLSEPPWRLKAQVTRARCQAALHCSRTDAVLAHESAAFVHGLPLWEAEPDITTIQRTAPRRVIYRYPVVDYPHPSGPADGGSTHPGPTHPGSTRPRPTRPGRRTVHRRRVQVLPEEDVVYVEGLRVTSLERTVLDCARELHPRDALVVVDGHLRGCALASGSDDVDDPGYKGAEQEARASLLARLEGLKRGGARRGIKRARAIVEQASARAESPLESALRWVILQAGFPEPVLQMPVSGPHGRYRVDLAWPRHRILVEADGLLKYTGQDGRALAQEKIREDDLRRLGTVLRFIWVDVASLTPVVEELVRAFPDDVVANLHPVPGLQPPPNLRQFA
ncbi:hypothetical protein MANAM107_05500 [Actinomyces capricornis]|uniref:DUF559 domain-containing protein n=3 Tax=Actinomyces TaxID=1654 RepID=A0ABN6K5T0_9ACTO|nr:hypothetical protein MANAM107_05500 [Actinomyces capricornis]